MPVALAIIFLGIGVLFVGFSDRLADRAARGGLLALLTGWPKAFREDPRLYKWLGRCWVAVGIALLLLSLLTR